MIYRLAPCLAVTLMAAAAVGQWAVVNKLRAGPAPYEGAVGGAETQWARPSAAAEAQLGQEDDDDDDDDELRASAYRKLDAFDRSVCGRRLVKRQSRSLLASSSPLAGARFNLSRLGGFVEEASANRMSVGWATYAGEFPWYVMVRTRYPGRPGQALCGGVIIGSDMVLTAAHCVTDGRNRRGTYELQAGVHDRRDESRGQVRHGKTSCYSASYNGVLAYYTASHDLAVIKLAKPFRYDQFVQPACLPDLDQPPARITGTCELAGYGRIAGTTIPKNLMAMPMQACSGGSKIPDQLCFRSADGKKFPGSPCMGDSGGGIYCRDPDDRFQAVALVSNSRASTCRRGFLQDVHFAGISLLRNELKSLIDQCQNK